MVADGVNALLYAAEGNYKEAGKSALAAVPVIGEKVAAAKQLKKAHNALKTFNELQTIKKYGKKAEDTAEFIIHNAG